MKLLIALIILVMAPVSWGQDTTNAIKHPPHPRILQFEGLHKAYQASAVSAIGYPYDTTTAYDTTPVRYAPLNTRLQIHWLDSVPVVRCYLTYVNGFDYDSLGASFWIHDSLLICDTLYWRMTECSLSVIEEGE